MALSAGLMLGVDVGCRVKLAGGGWCWLRDWTGDRGDHAASRFHWCRCKRESRLCLLREKKTQLLSQVQINFSIITESVYVYLLAMPACSVRADEELNCGRRYDSTVWPAPSSSSDATERGCHPRAEVVTPQGLEQRKQEVGLRVSSLVEAQNEEHSEADGDKTTHFDGLYAL